MEYADEKLESAEKFRERYRVASARMSDWDYSSSGAYFVTVCTRDREHFFGEIVQGVMRNSFLGDVANECWKEIPSHFPCVIADVFVVMPNHVHGVLFIRNNVSDVVTSVETQNNNVETQNFASLRGRGNVFGPQSKNLASIIRGFKVGVTKRARKEEVYFFWQSRFYDRIIRDERELNRIHEYIVMNPRNWDLDSENTNIQKSWV